MEQVAASLKAASDDFHRVQEDMSVQGEGLKSPASMSAARLQEMRARLEQTNTELQRYREQYAHIKERAVSGSAVEGHTSHIEQLRDLQLQHDELHSAISDAHAKATALVEAETLARDAVKMRIAQLERDLEEERKRREAAEQRVLELSGRQ